MANIPYPYDELRRVSLKRRNAWWRRSSIQLAFIVVYIFFGSAFLEMLSGITRIPYDVISKIIVVIGLLFVISYCNGNKHEDALIDEIDRLSNQVDQLKAANNRGIQ